VLNNPENVAGIADLIHSLYQQPELCRTVGSNAASTAKSYTWERNAGETWSFLLSALQRKDIEASHPFVERVLSQGPMVAIGRASYSLYLWHWPIFSLIDYRLFLSSPAVRIGSKVLLTIAATTISYLFVERPSRVLLNDPAKRWLAFAVFGCSLATLVPLGIEIRRANYVDATIRDVARGGLHFNQSAKGGSMVLMGDSNGAMYGKMMVELAKEQNLKLDVISVPAGDPLPHSSGEPSPLWLYSLNVVRREKPNFLVLVCNWNKLEGDEGRLRVALDQLAPVVGQIILFTQPPEPPPSATREGMRKGARPPFMEDTEERAHRLEHNEVVRSARGEKVSVVDVEPMFSKKSGEVVFFDEHGNPAISRSRSPIGCWRPDRETTTCPSNK